MASDFDEKFADLESRLAFQDDLLHAMNTRVAEQDKEIAALTLQLQHINEKLKQYQEQAESQGFGGANEVPPHY
jgi:SlyX protein